MKTLKFISNHNNQKQFAGDVRKNVNAYFKKNNLSTKGNNSMYIKTFILLSIYIMPFIIILSAPIHIWIAGTMVIIMGIGEAGIGMSVMHDAAHGALSNKAWVNKLFASTMYLLGSNTFNWQIQHNIMHHTFTNIYQYDQDIETKAALRLCEHAPKKKHHRFQHIYAFFLYGMMTLSKLVTDIFQLIAYNKAGITKEQKHRPNIELLRICFLKIIYFSIIIGLPLLITSYKWWQVFIGFSILHITAGIIMSTIFQMAHVVEGAKQPTPNKHGIIETEWMVHQLLTTSDFSRNNAILNWYAGGLNFQIEHHLFPNICHIHYKHIAPIVEKTAKQYDLKYNLKPTFLSALNSHIKRLKKLGQKTNAYRPSLLRIEDK